MGSIVQLIPQEVVKLNGFHIAQLYKDLGRHCAERVISKALVDIADRLERCETAQRAGNLKELRKQARALSAVAAQIGLAALQVPVAHMLHTAEQGDQVACHATVARLHRLVQGGLQAATDLQRSRQI